MRTKVVVGLTLLILLSCSSNDRLTRVAKVVHIDTPSNLSASEDCVALWGNIQRFGAEMDQASPEWNKIVIQSAYELIEKGCVRRAGESVAQLAPAAGAARFVAASQVRLPLRVAGRAAEARVR